MIPVMTLLASILPILVGGALIVEYIFDIPGMGKYAYEGLLRRDFNVIMATTLFVGIMTQFGILLSGSPTRSSTRGSAMSELSTKTASSLQRQESAEQPEFVRRYSKDYWDVPSSSSATRSSRWRPWS